jgi:ribonuclease BN (tRNA processing enzyme)
MHVRILGSGTIAGETNRNCSGYLVDDSLLVDCGPGIWRALHEWNGGCRSISHILLSHLHVDHIADLVPILWNRYVLASGKQVPLTIHGPAGCREWYRSLTRVHEDWIREMPVLVEDYPADRFRIGEYEIRAAYTRHTDSSVCLRVTDPSGASFFYSGDTGPDDALEPLAADADLAIVEAAAPSGSAKADHLTVAQAARLAHTARVGMLLLTHIYPEAFSPRLLDEARAVFMGPTQLAQDGMSVLVRPASP